MIAVYGANVGPGIEMKDFKESRRAQKGASGLTRLRLLAGGVV